MIAPDAPVIPFQGQDLSSASTSEQVALVEKLLSIGTALSSSQNLEEILHLILSKSREITWSDAGSVYLVHKTDSSHQLLFKVVQNDSLPNLPFQEITLPLTLKSLAGYVALTGETLNLPDAYKISGNVPYQLDRSFDQDFSYRTCSVLVLPMQDQEGEVIGVLQLINRKKHPHVSITPENAIAVTQPYSEWEERILRSLASQAAISIERNLLQGSIENLFEGFVKASVELIELRDPTTSGHSERVAELSVRLSQEISCVSMGRLGSIQFSDRQIQEVRYAALLHDFGKVCVPETILNKRKKLYPEQLQIIRQRFALAQRTLESECAQKKFQYLLQHPHPVGDHLPTRSCHHCHQLEKFDQDRLEAIATLQEYLSLIEVINEPEAIPTKRFEALSEETFAKLTTLSEYTYRDIDGQSKPLINPEEMEQLLIPRGNLTPLERLAIEAHVTHTYKFLQRLPWTKTLKDVPLIAYGHHEKLDGSGYPRGLTQENIPPQTQILTIADIYDALTASDRPYKKPLSVEIVLKILREEADKNKLNAEFVEIFEQRQVYQVLGHH